MNGIDAHKAGTSLRAGGFANADRVAHRAGLGEAPALGLIAGALAQVVQVRDGQLGQALVAGIVIVPVGPLQEVRDRRPADVFMGLVHLDEQRHVDGGVFARKGRGRRTVALGQGDCSQAVTLPTGHQTSDLRPAVAAGVLQVPQQHATLALVATGVVKACEDATDVPIPLAIVACRRELNRGAGAEKLLDLLDRRQPCFVHVDHHPCDDQPTPHFTRNFFRSGSFLGGKTPLVQAHTTLDKAPYHLSVPHCGVDPIVRRWQLVTRSLDGA